MFSIQAINWNLQKIPTGIFQISHVPAKISKCLRYRSIKLNNAG
jgi:hypothetical protein